MRNLPQNLLGTWQSTFLSTISQLLKPHILLNFQRTISQFDFYSGYTKVNFSENKQGIVFFYLKPLTLWRNLIELTYSNFCVHLIKQRKSKALSSSHLIEEVLNLLSLSIFTYLEISRPEYLEQCTRLFSLTITRLIPMLIYWKRRPKCFKVSKLTRTEPKSFMKFIVFQCRILDLVEQEKICPVM